MEIEEALKEALDMQEQGSSSEEILTRLRAGGASAMVSLKVIRKIECVTIPEAKEIIDSSATWADMREVHEHIRGTLIRAALEEGARQVPP
jgi:hypothetical protein